MEFFKLAALLAFVALAVADPLPSMEEEEDAESKDNLATEPDWANFGKNCFIQNSEKIGLVQGEEHTLQAKLPVLDSDFAYWSIKKWQLDDGEFFEIQNDDSFEFIGVINDGDEEKDDYQIITTPFHYLFKNPGNLWQLQREPSGQYIIKHMNTELFLTLDSEKKISLEQATPTKWSIICPQ
ncbi:uncharacterized protein LOC135940845 [Cloeon dipterum]|uniref:uncharacterized protein LOC135940845 n=1 Tax=Cloeon dipterum TaxID=197152 RepID=UPI00321F8C24